MAKVVTCSFLMVSIVTVPRQDEIRPGLLLEIIDEMGLTREEFLKILSTI